MRDDYNIYEYISVNVKKDLEQAYIDCYKNFGWIYINKNEKTDYYINSNTNPNLATIKFKRKRDINNKEELKKLQKNCEKAIENINKLENMPHSLATAYSLAVGLIALIFIVLSVFLSTKNIWWGAIISGIIGIIACIFPYRIYKKIISEKEIENKTQIDEQYKIIYNDYEQVKKILLKDE